MNKVVIVVLVLLVTFSAGFYLASVVDNSGEEVVAPEAVAEDIPEVVDEAGAADIEKEAIAEDVEIGADAGLRLRIIPLSSELNVFSSYFDREVSVFGVPVIGAIGVDEIYLMHAASIMSEYLDNDEDGSVDDSNIVDAMIDNRAVFMVIMNEDDLERFDVDFDSFIAQPVFVDTDVSIGYPRDTSTFDATLEEVLHLITQAGYAYAYPEAFEESSGSLLTDAMDVARGGQFMTIPSSYPSEAWYTYDDSTCEYNCMAAEYIYWSLTSILGAQEGRLDDIGEEWKLNTKEKVREGDVLVYDLLVNSEYTVPTRLPDGKYRV
jgi:hypothetical protein